VATGILLLAGCSENNDTKIEVLIANSTAERKTIRAKFLRNGETITTKTYNLNGGKSNSSLQLSHVPDVIILEYGNTEKEINFSLPDSCSELLGINIGVKRNSDVEIGPVCTEY
jgi:hypothetical protein